jgi:phosphoglycolate phosphatase
MTIRAAFFDLDGTLVDSLGDLTSAVNHVRKLFSLSPLSENDVRIKIGKGARNLIQQSLPGVPESEIARALAIFLDYNKEHIAEKTGFYPGILNTLHDLAAMQIRMAVITNKNEELCLLLLRELGINNLFDCACGGDTYAERKPSPVPLLKIAEKLGVSPRECVMIGDSINDVESGQRAAMKTIACSWGYGDITELNGADLIVDTPSELVGAIIRLSGQIT